MHAKTNKESKESVTPVYLGALNALLKSLCIVLFFSGRKGAVRNLKYVCLKREIPKSMVTGHLLLIKPTARGMIVEVRMKKFGSV